MSGRGKRRIKAEHEDGGRFAAIYHWVARTEAWRSLDTVARCAYLELKSRYNGANNGFISCSVREMAEALNVSKATAQRALQRLQDVGFIVMTKQGAFSMKVRHASEWRLTEHPDQRRLGGQATKDFTHWKKSSVSPRHPNGSPDETEQVSR